MSFNVVRPLPLSENKDNAWKNRVAAAINSSNVIEGSGLTVDYSPYGSSINIAGGNDSLPLTWVGNFDINSEYYPNQIVRVLPDSRYINRNGVAIPVGSTSETGHAITPINAGLFICVNYIPASACSESWFNNVMVPQYPANTVPFDVVNGTRFYSYNVYYPIFPEIPTNYTASVTFGPYGFVANQTYWVALNPFGVKAFTACTNGVTETTYVMAYISGSAFRSEYLPYSP